jgi:hypothetical protein
MRFLTIPLLSLPLLPFSASLVLHLSTSVEAVNHLFKRDCPLADADVQKIVAPLKGKLQRGITCWATRVCSWTEFVVTRIDVCGKGIEPGTAADITWVEETVLLKYLSKSFVGKALRVGECSVSTPIACSDHRRAGLNSDVNDLIEKCHKNTYNYCLLEDQDAVLMCAKDQVGGLIVS